MVVTVVVIATALEVKMVAVVGTALERGTSLETGTSLEKGTSLERGTSLLLGTAETSVVLQIMGFCEEVAIAAADMTEAVAALEVF